MTQRLVGSNAFHKKAARFSLSLKMVAGKISGHTLTTCLKWRTFSIKMRHRRSSVTIMKVVFWHPGIVRLEKDHRGQELPMCIFFSAEKRKRLNLISGALGKNVRERADTRPLTNEFSAIAQRRVVRVPRWTRRLRISLWKFDSQQDAWHKFANEIWRHELLHHESSHGKSKSHTTRLV